MARLKLRTDKSYPYIDNNIKTTKAPLIGFEWEVPINYRYFENDYDPDEEDLEGYVYYNLVRTKKLRNFQESQGLGGHVECGCYEFYSPVANTIEVARRSARNLIEWTGKQTDWFCHTDTEENNGGIHVSVSNPQGVAYSHQHFQNIMGMCNRESSADFIWHLSGREDQEHQWDGYKDQARSTGWDEDGNEQPFDNEMFRSQRGRIEYRLWANFPEYLIPALEFAHSTFIFCRNKKKIPYLRDYKEWLFKQKGYKELKSFANWSLIE
jgi:hypothetical protein